MKDPDRVAAKFIADSCGYYWLPCPRCGEWFGGHEHDRHNVPCKLSPTTFHHACCPKISDENDVQSCRRCHEMYGEPATPSGGPDR